MHPTRPIDDPRSDPLTLRLVAWVALGGAIGTSLRYGLGRLLPVGAGEVPWATLTANVVGAFVLGGLVVALDRWDRGPRRGDPRLRHLLALGLVGSFTTYSAFSVEVVDLLEGGSAPLAAAYVGATLVAGMAAVAVGASSVRSLERLVRDRRARGATRTVDRDGGAR